MGNFHARQVYLNPPDAKSAEIPLLVEWKQPQNAAKS
jgi:hypothetical protein